MKVFIPNNSKNAIGGGWTFLRNITNGLEDRVHFVNSLEDCDILFIVGVTMTDPSIVHKASELGKRIVFRVDNVPRKSRNRRNTPHERMKEFADLSDVVIYQSEWAKEYCYPLCGDGMVIYNGVDKTIFKNTNDDIERDNKYLFIYHGKNETKGFWHAHYIFQKIFRENKNAKFWFVYDFGRDLQELKDANFDFWNGENYLHLERLDTPQEVAEIMNQCGRLIYPAIADACPNTVLEARACGLDVVWYAENDMSATQELIKLDDISLERMCDEYYGVFALLMSGQDI